MDENDSPAAVHTAARAPLPCPTLKQLSHMLCGLARHAAAAPAQASRPNSIRRVSGVPQQRTCRCPKSLAVPEGGTEDAEAEGANPMFNSAFSAVLQQALQRQGEEALSTGPAQVPEEQ